MSTKREQILLAKKNLLQNTIEVGATFAGKSLVKDFSFITYGTMEQSQIQKNLHTILLSLLKSKTIQDSSYYYAKHITTSLSGERRLVMLSSGDFVGQGR